MSYTAARWKKSSMLPRSSATCSFSRPSRGRRRSPKTASTRSSAAFHGSLDLIERVLREGFAGQRSEALQMLAGELGQRARVEVARVSHAGRLHARAGSLLEGLERAVRNDLGKGLN